MANLRDTLNTIMPNQPRMRKLFPTGPSVNQSDRKHVRFRTRVLAQESLDMHELIVELRSNEPIEETVHVQTIIDSVKQLQNELVRKVIYDGFEITNSEFALYNSAEIRFRIISDVEKP